MARAKCKICGTPLDTNTAYKVADKNGKNKYFCSASEFEAEEIRKKKAQEDKDRVYYLICDIMGEKEILNTALWKEKIEWNKVFSDEFIAKYLQENKDYLTSAITRLNSSQFAKIRYLSAILKNSLSDFKPKVVEVEKPKVVVTEEYYETKYKSKTRRALEDLEEDCDE
jgi:YHS domain-containing protein